MSSMNETIGDVCSLLLIDEIRNNHHEYKDRQIDSKNLKDLRRLIKEAWMIYNILKWIFKKEMTIF